jgi:anti-anti-sigma regulatory factor
MHFPPRLRVAGRLRRSPEAERLALAAKEEQNDDHDQDDDEHAAADVDPCGDRHKRSHAPSCPVARISTSGLVGCVSLTRLGAQARHGGNPITPAPRDASDATPRVRTVTGLGHRCEVVVVFVHGEHDYGSRTVLEEALAPLGGAVVVDLSWCAFLDSSIVAVILSKHAELKKSGDRLEVIIPPAQEHLASLFDVLGLRALVQVRERLTYR